MQHINDNPLKRVFEPSIPAHLLTNATPEMRFLLESVDVLRQKTDFVMEECISQSEEISEIKVQTTKTNGKVMKHEEIFETFKGMTKDLTDLIGTKRRIEGMLKSKYFWIIAAATIIGIVKICMDPLLREAIAKLL